MKKYLLIQGKSAETGKVILKSDYKTVLARKRELSKSTPKKGLYSANRRQFFVVPEDFG